ncbi:hypothetical protein DWU98_13145 [Dyella monticola]|uniref:Uncharacterized protein n=1 Tax=Dyella monticola TaxID=1927958 RepID=A0A370WXS2_9GAMM|nr:hypothetical protein DWU98_13145 [Dyella monticola]
MAVGLPVLATASEPSATGLGQAWPNAADVSASPNWHVYVFVLNGVKYIQVNDLNGNVIGAVGTAGGQFITLPIGRFAQYVSTQPTQSSRAITVYRDNATVISVTPTSNGIAALNAASTSDDPCQDPEQCGSGGSP